MKATKTKHPDHRYIEALIRHENVLISEIYKNNAATITKLIVSNNGTAEDAQDIMQEVLLALYRQGQNGFILTCPLQMFLYIACRNRWINKLRGKKPKQVTIQEISGFMEDATTAVQDFEEQEAQDRLFSKHYQLLGPSCQEILRLSWTENDTTQRRYSLIDIAEKLNLSYDYVRRKIGECRQQLLKMIQADPDYQLLKEM
ncbi:MAG TPA: sigma-70 family RNA polymerase sigma factor [Saprospiraceae bacterium]|nr:sigma-70 family RNA polymerase sigma factor [Saprospiraceae bacterium]HMP25033.1 sigma-70 family RNA polymerase sigma factor [Saprospiraceae bacterium]